MSEKENSHRRSYLCMDVNAEGIPGSEANLNGTLLYLTDQARCGSLKYPPYVEGDEIPCVV